jgi:hypothetical protein
VAITSKNKTQNPFDCAQGKLRLKHTVARRRHPHPGIYQRKTEALPKRAPPGSPGFKRSRSLLLCFKSCGDHMLTVFNFVRIEGLELFDFVATLLGRNQH